MMVSLQSMGLISLILLLLFRDLGHESEPVVGVLFRIRERHPQRAVVHVAVIQMLDKRRLVG